MKSKNEKRCIWWCVACAGLYDWKEADTILTIRASSRVEDTWVFAAHAPPVGVCDSLISALKLLVNLQEKESLIDVVCGGTKIWWREEHGGGSEAVH